MVSGTMADSVSDTTMLPAGHQTHNILYGVLLLLHCIVHKYGNVYGIRNGKMRIQYSDGPTKKH